MAKLPIPISAVIGESLTKEELKHVLGGNAQMKQKKCVCVYIKTQGSTSEELAADDAFTCGLKCHNFCKNDSECIDYHTQYTESDV